MYSILLDMTERLRDPVQHRPLRRGDRRQVAQGAREGRGERAAAGGPLHAAQREARGAAGGGPRGELGLRARPPVVRDEQLIHEPGARADRALDAPWQIRRGSAPASQKGSFASICSSSS